MSRPPFHRFRPLPGRCAGSSLGEQLILICCGALGMGLVASLFLRYGGEAWLPLGAGLLAFAAFMAAVIWWNERRNRLARRREEERRRGPGEKPAGGHRGTGKESSTARE